MVNIIQDDLVGRMQTDLSAKVLDPGFGHRFPGQPPCTDTWTK